MIIEGWFVLFCLVIGPMLCVAAILICGLFKKKYVRSEWMEGLLWAEHLMGKYGTEENMSVEDTDGMEGYNILWRNCSHEKPWRVKTCNKEFGNGVLDYLENKLK